MLHSYTGQELESVRSKRAGRKGADDVDPAWMSVEGNTGPRKVASPWQIGDLYAYQVWAELSKEGTDVFALGYLC